MKALGIRSRLTVPYAGLFLLVVVILGSAFFRVLSSDLDRELNRRLDHLCTGLWGYIAFDGDKPVLTFNREDHSVLEFLRTASRYYQLYDGQSGRVVAQSEDSALMHLAVSPADALRLLRHPGFDETRRFAPLRFRSIVFHASGRAYVLRVGVSLADDETAMRQIRDVLLLLLPVAVLASVMVTWVISGKALKPVRELRLAAHDISISNLNRRLPSRGSGDEIDLLAATFNDVFLQLEESVNRMKEFTAGISHELRTPLACLQGEAELALADARMPDCYRQVLTSQLEEFHKLNRLIDALLLLARAEAGEIGLALQRLDLSTLIAGLVEQIRFIADTRHVHLELRCDSPVPAIADPQWLERAALNLIDNAVKFTPAGGTVTLETAVHDGWATLRTSDTGIGISERDLPKIFDRFYRADGSRSKAVEGIGLGLTITKWIVEAHHGTIAVESMAGRGSCFTVQLPTTRETAPALPPAQAFL